MSNTCADPTSSTRDLSNAERQSPTRSSGGRQTPSTPSPVDAAERIKLIEKDEKAARDSLVKYGCPPCCPTGQRVSYASDAHDGVPYYQSIPSYDDTPLCGQLWEWEDRFRPFQKRVRMASFATYAGKVRNRREEHQLQGNTELDSCLIQQTPLQHWTEYQGFLIQNLELAQAQRKNTEHYEKVLRWTERERRMMGPSSASEVHAPRRRQPPRRCCRRRAIEQERARRSTKAGEGIHRPLNQQRVDKREALRRSRRTIKRPDRYGFP